MSDELLRDEKLLTDLPAANGTLASGVTEKGRRMYAMYEERFGKPKLACGLTEQAIKVFKLAIIQRAEQAKVSNSFMDAANIEAQTPITIDKAKELAKQLNAIVPQSPQEPDLLKDKAISFILMTILTLGGIIHSFFVRPIK